MISMVEAGAAVAVNVSASASRVEVNERGTMGSHIAKRLLELGIQDVFTVPGDYNLGLMDELLAFQPELRNVGCCNELNAGYAADGYARARGVAACVVTFTVGGLSLLNAIAGSYSENLPVICIMGGPNTNDYGSGRILHHTIGLPDFTQELRCFQTVTCYQAVVNDLDHAHAKIDTAITTALRESKPVYISISCNIANVQHSSFKEFVPYAPHPTTSNAESLAAAANFLNTKLKPVMVAGPNIRVGKAGPAFEALASASGYAVAAMAAAKGQISESQAHYIGTYLGCVSTPFCCEIVESADAYLFAGPVFNDYSSAGYSILIKSEKMVEVQPNRVTIANGATFGCVLMQDFLNALAAKVTYNSTAFDNRQRIITPQGQLPDSPKDRLHINILYKHIQTMLTDDTALIIDTGDSSFNCMKLHLPHKCGYEFQMQYGSMGWSVGATLGYAQAATDKRVITCIGDGSFQMTAQEVSTMIRNGQKNIIFLINNGGYTSEAQIHDGTYNIIKNWNYTALIDAMHNNEGKCWTTRVQTEEELVKAIEAVGVKKDHLCFIEAVTNKDDTSVEVLEWGAMVASANGRAHVARQ